MNLDILFSIIVGGSLTLLGTLLANFLQYRSEERKIKKVRASERMVEIRRYLLACLNFADSVSIPTTLGAEKFGKVQIEEWYTIMSDRIKEWKHLPVSGSGRILFTADKELLNGLKEIDSIRLQFYLNYQSLITEGSAIQLDDKREELKTIASKLNERLDKLVDEV